MRSGWKTPCVSRSGVSITLDDPVSVHVLLFDQRGKRLKEFPVAVAIENYRTTSGSNVWLSHPGVFTATVTYDGKTATAQIVVRPKR